MTLTLLPLTLIPLTFMPLTLVGSVAELLTISTVQSLPPYSQVPPVFPREAGLFNVS